MFLDDSHLKRSLFSPVCNFCQHFHENSAFGETKTCAAFPSGIPEEIWQGKNKHLTPYPGDNGITFLRRTQ